MNLYDVIAEASLAGKELTDEQAMAVLDCPDDDLLPLLHAAYRVRKNFYGKKVKLNMIINTKSGLCSENCGYCAQSIVSKAPIEKYSMMKKEIGRAHV